MKGGLFSGMQGMINFVQEDEVRKPVQLDITGLEFVQDTCAINYLGITEMTYPNTKAWGSVNGSRLCSQLHVCCVKCDFFERQ